MQIHIEAHLIQFLSSPWIYFLHWHPAAFFCCSLLVSAEWRVWDQYWVVAPLKSVSDEGRSVLVEIQRLRQYDTARECCLFPVLLLWTFMLAVPIRSVFDLSKKLFLAINSASLWDLNYRLVLNFVLFLHQLGWSQRLFCLSQHVVQAQEHNFQNVFLGRVNNCGRALGT